MEKLVKYLFSLIVIFQTFSAFNCFADIYEYTDNNGTLHFTDDVSNVPINFRNKAKKASDSSLTNKESKMLDAMNGGNGLDDEVKDIKQFKRNLNSYADYAGSELGNPGDPVDPRLSTPEGALKLFKHGLETGNLEEIKAAVTPEYFASMDRFESFTKAQLKSLSSSVPENTVTKINNSKSATIEFRGFKVQVVRPFDNWRLVKF